MHPNVKALIEREYAAQKSEEWLALRGNMLTASDAASAIGVNKYQTPEELLLKKCGLGEKFTGTQLPVTVSCMKMKPVSYMNSDTEKSSTRLDSYPIPNIIGWVEVLTEFPKVENSSRSSVLHKGLSSPAKYPNIICRSCSFVWRY